MKKCDVEIRPITIVDYVNFFKEQPARTIRGYSFFLNGEQVAVFGALLDKNATMLFSDVKEGLSVHPVIVWRWAKRALELINDMRQPLYATSKNSERFLLTLGFVFRGDTKYGKLYEYLG
jgi:hypothetical protein